MEQDLMQKLMKSKAIMDIHNNMNRVTDSNIINSNNPTIENFEAPSAKYNIPQEFMQEASIVSTKTMESPSVDAIKNSKLPDEIKRIILEFLPKLKNPMLLVILIFLSWISAFIISVIAKLIFGDLSDNIMNYNPFLNGFIHADWSHLICNLSLIFIYGIFYKTKYNFTYHQNGCRL